MTRTTLELQLRERLDVLEGHWLNKDSKSIVRELYTADTEITGEGCEEIFRGQKALKNLVNSLVADSHSVKIELDRAVILDEKSAYSWVNWEVVPLEGSPFPMKSLFVWSLTNQGWRIIADMYAQGRIAA